MPKLYAREKGQEYRIGNHGTATHDRPAVVPEAVAEELAAHPGLRIEADEVPAAAPRKKTPAPEAEKE